MSGWCGRSRSTRVSGRRIWKATQQRCRFPVGGGGGGGGGLNMGLGDRKGVIPILDMVEFGLANRSCRRDDQPTRSKLRGDEGHCFGGHALAGL